MILCRILAALLVLTLFPARTHAQSTTASLTGRITDSRRTVIGMASVQVTNTGTRNGDEIVQLYVRPVKSAADRPMQELKGFTRIALKAGGSKMVTLILTQKDFATYDEKSSAWLVPPGEYQLAVGRSSRDICGTLSVTW